MASIIGAILAVGTAGCGRSAGTPRTPSTPALTSTTAAPSTAVPASGCVPEAGARILANSSSARLLVKSGVVYACLHSGKGFKVGYLGGCDQTHRDTVSHVVLAGQFLASAQESCGIDTGDAGVVVTRLGSQVQATSFGATIGLTGPESFYSIGSLVAKPDGAVAWIGNGGGISGKRVVEVHVARGNTDSEIDSGPQIKKGSLRLDGSKLTWQRGGATRSATLS